MITDNLYKIIFLSVILFLFVNFFVGSKREKKLVNDIILQRQDLDESGNGFVYEVEKLKSEYLSNRFKTIITRSIFFGLGLFGIIFFMSNPNRNKIHQKIDYFENPPF